MRNEPSGCLVWLILIGILVALGSLVDCVGGIMGKDEVASSGSIPPRFQGAYNSIACGSTDFIDGLVTVGDDDVRYGGGTFKVTGIRSENPSEVVLVGAPSSFEGNEPERSFTITYAEVGATARIDGAEYERCSQY